MTLARFFFTHCYSIEDSSSYKRVKKLFYDLFENPRSFIRSLYNVFMILLVLASVLLMYAWNIYWVSTES